MPEPSVDASVEAHKNGGGPVARASAVIRSGVRAQQVGAGYESKPNGLYGPMNV